jgi:hypothetical protein
VKSSFLLAGLATLFSLGCSAEIPLGAEPSLWMADHETGDLSQWKEGGTGDTFVSSDGSLSIVESPVHGGRYAVKSSISSTKSPSLARLFRQSNLPAEAYYSVWFYIPQLYAVGQWWNVFEFSGRWEQNNSNTGVALWSLDLRQESNDRLVWYVYDKLGERELTAELATVASLGRWVQVTAFVRQATDKTGQVTFWIDDQLLIDERGLATLPSDWMSWAVGNVAEGMPQAADLYLDDAMISSQRPGG